jgi:hypothetical protein
MFYNSKSLNPIIHNEIDTINLILNNDKIVVQRS